MKVLLGAVFSLPPFSPGRAWNRLQHALGLRDLGHDVWILEEVDPSWWVDEGGRPCPPERSVNRRSFVELCRQFGFEGRSVQAERGGGPVGMSDAELARVSRDADLLINWSGHIENDVVLGGVDRNAYVDLDPVYTQLWLAEHGASSHVLEHDVFLTVGLDIGTDRTHIPSVGIEWRPMLPPVVLDLQPFAAAPGGAPWTTVASWTSYSDVTFDGEWYRSKNVEFARLAALPSRCNAAFEVALKSWREKDPDIARLRNGGWRLLDASRIGDLRSYRNYILSSRGEIGVAKHAYVHGRSGWFSDRSAHYLATGRPVVAQHTGFEAHLPTGEGLIGFSTLEEAADAVERVSSDYAAHARAAREFAAEYLDHRKVLPALLDACASESRAAAR